MYIRDSKRVHLFQPYHLLVYAEILLPKIANVFFLELCYTQHYLQKTILVVKIHQSVMGHRTKKIHNPRQSQRRNIYLHKNDVLKEMINTGSVFQKDFLQNLTQIPKNDVH